MRFEEALLIWTLAMSLAAFCLYGWDKRQAKRPLAGRIREWHLLGTAALGGWPGALTGMLLFRHKTRKRWFQFRFFFAVILWLGLVCALKLVAERVP